MTPEHSPRLELLNSLKTTWLSPPLLGRGFKHRRGTWYRERVALTDVVETQVATPSAGPDIRFTINLGIYSKEVYEAVWSQPSPRAIKQSDCVVGLRIGRLSGLRVNEMAKDLWWRLAENGDVEKVGADAKSRIESEAIPFFDSCTSHRDLLKLLQQHPGLGGVHQLSLIYQGSLHMILGEHESAKQCLEEAVRDDVWRPRADVASENLGL